MILLTTLYKDYIDRQNCLEKKPVEYIVPPPPKKKSGSEQKDYDSTKSDLITLSQLHKLIARFETMIKSFF